MTPAGASGRDALVHTLARAEVRRRLDAATTDLDPPLAAVDLEAWDANATDLRRRAGGVPIRVASKSVRSRGLLRNVLARDGYRGILAMTLAEALWLASTGVSDDVVVGYPSVDRASIARLAGDESLAARVTLMIDDAAHLDLVDAVAPPGRRAPIAVCLDFDCSWRPLGSRPHIGARRSPVHSSESLAELASAVGRRPGFRVVGVMAYDAQIAGVPDAPPGRRVYGRMVRGMQRLSWRELTERRGAAVNAVRQVADLRFVNAGGTGSVHRSAADPSVTEVSAGSGLFAPHLFDGYTSFSPRPAAFFALPVVRRPGPGVVTVAGGGWVASGPAGPDRLPLPWLPAGLRLDRREGAGETQTPVFGPAADSLAIGDRVWFRHAKAGELADHVDVLHLVRGSRVVDSATTYRGDGVR